MFLHYVTIAHLLLVGVTVSDLAQLRSGSLKTGTMELTNCSTLFGEGVTAIMYIIHDFSHQILSFLSVRDDFCTYISLVLI